jgi:hypothetical protein
MAENESTRTSGHRGGRPRKPPGERRRHKYLVSANDAEQEAIECRAASAGLKPSVYLRQAGVGAKLGVRHANQVYHRLSRISLTVKELAGAAGADGRPDEQVALEALLAEVLRLRNEF